MTSSVTNLKQKLFFHYHTLTGKNHVIFIISIFMTLFLLKPVVVDSALNHQALFFQPALDPPPATRGHQAPCTAIEKHKILELLTNDRDETEKTDGSLEESGDGTKSEAIRAPGEYKKIKERKIIEEAKAVEAAKTEEAIAEDNAPLSPYHHIILKAAQRYNLDPALIRAIIMVESANNPNAVSKSGAKGLMQLMPDTARELGVNNIFNPESNIDGGTKYLHRMLDRFGGDVTLALAAYNAGSRHVLNYGGVPPFKETRRYVKKVLARYEAYQGEM